MVGVKILVRVLSITNSFFQLLAEGLAHPRWYNIRIKIFITNNLFPVSTIYIVIIIVITNN